MGLTTYILYKNHKGELAWRKVYVLSLFIQADNPYHPGIQHFVKVYDIEKKAERDFAMTGVRKWQYEAPSV